MKPIRKALLGAAIVGSTLTGGALGAALINGSASAASTPSTTAASSAPANPGRSGGPGPGGRPGDPSKGGHVGANGVTEKLLNGETAAKVKAAALAAVPGGTVQRVENDAEGSPYEAHMTKADGSQVTVKVNDKFVVTSTESGPR